MTKNLTQIDGISMVTAEQLLDAKIDTIEQLSSSSPEKIAEITGVSVVIAKRWIARANNFLKNRKKPKIPPGKKITSKYSMKTTTKRDMEEN